MLCGGFQGGHDAVVVIPGVGVQLGVPDHLLRVDAFPVDDSGNFPVGTAGIKPDAAALQMAANGLWGVLGGGQVVTGNHFKGALIYIGHEVAVKSAAA